jgi:hypothetical protein
MALGQVERAAHLYVCYLMAGGARERVSEIRALAAQLRMHAAETSVQMFRCKFEAAALELEQRAMDAESRQRFRYGRVEFPHPISRRG